MSEYDVIVVGAGVGGLAAAAVLSKHGRKVAVLEKNPAPGGFATSFRRGRFEFEVSLHELCGFGRGEEPLGGVRMLFDELGISDKIDWTVITEAYRLITFDESNPIDITMPFGIENYINKAESAVPDCRDGLEKLFSLSRIHREGLAALGKAKTPEEKMSVLRNRPDFTHTISMSVNQGCEAVGLPKRAADIFKGYWAYLCADGDDLTLFHYLSMVNSYIELGSVIPKLRSRELALTLADAVEENGGEIFLNTPVKEIKISGGSATGVICENGSFITAKHVLCDLSPHYVYTSLIASSFVTDNTARRLNAREISGRGFCTFLGLDRSANELGLNEYSYFIYPDMDISKQCRLMAMPETNRVQNSVCINAANPGASPEGTCILTLTTLFTSDYWSTVPDTDYHKTKDAFALSMAETFERATGAEIRGHIEEIESASPQTFARFSNSTQGAIYGYRAARWDGTLARSMMYPDYGDIPALSFTGGYSKLLNGFSSSMSAGADAARRIIGNTR